MGLRDSVMIFAIADESWTFSALSHKFIFSEVCCLFQWLNVEKVVDFICGCCLFEGFTFQRKITNVWVNRSLI